MAIMPLTVDPPPRPRPRTCGRGSCARVRRDSSPCHWNAAHADSSSARQPLRLRSSGGASLARQSGPASSSTTSLAESSLRRAASTQPALPPPTTTQSASIVCRARRPALTTATARPAALAAEPAARAPPAACRRARGSGGSGDVRGRWSGWTSGPREVVELKSDHILRTVAVKCHRLGRRCARSGRVPPMPERAAIVTGASRGIGFALAGVLAEEGYAITLTARKPEPLEQAADRLREQGAEVQHIAANMADDESVR